MIPKMLKTIEILFILFQVAEFVNITTIKSVNKSGPTMFGNRSIPETYLNILNEVTNATESENRFISQDNFKSLIRSLGLSKRSRESKIYKNHTVKCHSYKEMMRWYSKDYKGLTKEEFLNVCPVLLVQISSQVCQRRPPIPEEKNNLKIWLYSFGAVTVCSLIGLLVVWLIPLMPKSYYNSISQLLIALAVGSLTGDALLHLIPHALLDNGMGGHSHGGHKNSTHSQMVWKSLIALVGIHLFFLTERITILCQNLKSKRKLKIKQLVEENYSGISAGEKMDDSGKFPSKKDENKPASSVKLQWATRSRKYNGSSKDLNTNSHKGLDGEKNFGAHLCNRPTNKQHDNSDCPDSMNIDLCNTMNQYPLNHDSPGCNPNNFDLKQQINGEIKFSNVSHMSEDNKTKSVVVDELAVSNNKSNFSARQKDNKNWFNKEEYRLLDQQSPNDGNQNYAEVKLLNPKHKEDDVELGAGGATVISSLAHPYKNKPHGHHHGHSHDLSSVKAIAYTVIAGDGLHNFCDGIAIGAAFAKDISGGFSTAIAVLCHELPHELGDFVVLLHAGMSLRTAIFYNLMSSIFCAVGMVIGVQLGKLPSISSWIFMLTAGMFLYIALVDMIPELSTRRLTGKKIFHRPSILFLWQNIGFLIGTVIMLIIALYEDHVF